MIDNKQICSFEIHGQLMGIEVSVISEIVKSQNITRVPKAESYISGLINLRGNILTAIDLKAILSLEDEKINPYEMMIILNTGGSRLALSVNKVLDIIPFQEEELEKLNLDSTLERAKYFTGIYRFKNENILIFNTEKLLQLVQ